MNMYARKLRALVLMLLMIPTLLLAEGSQSLVSDLQHDWAIANYKLAGDEQEAAFEALIERADAAVANNQQSADLLIWNGIIKSSYAGAKGGLGALGLAKAARKSLEKALKVDGEALNGSAYTSLGTLYSQVPGWPVGFGSDKKAVQLLRKALDIDPDGIDSNYFYADYLLQQKEFAEAEKYLIKAQNAAPRPDRPIADAGRQEEIQAALSVTRKKLKRSSS
jgi:tetratricopeptide (TPR) repeat protein